MLVLMGPVFPSAVSEKGLEHSLKDSGISLELRRKSFRILQDIPILPMSVLDQYIRMLHYAITGNTLDMDMIITQYTESTGKESREQERSFTDYERERNREQTMLQCIREGNRNYHQILDDAVRMSRYSLGLDTPLGEAKDIVIIFAATCTRAAVEGGISNKSGREMEIRYLHEIEACSRVTDLAVLRRRIMDECVEAVCEVIQESTVSRPIQACCDYVKAHFNEPIDLKDIAKKCWIYRVLPYKTVSERGGD